MRDEIYIMFLPAERLYVLSLWNNTFVYYPIGSQNKWCIWNWWSDWSDLSYWTNQIISLLKCPYQARSVRGDVFVCWGCRCGIFLLFWYCSDSVYVGVLAVMYLCVGVSIWDLSSLLILFRQCDIFFSILSLICDVAG